MPDYLAVAQQAGVVLEDLQDGDDARWYAIIRGSRSFTGVVRGWKKAAFYTVGQVSVIIVGCDTQAEAQRAFSSGSATYAQQVRADIALHGFGNFYFSEHYRSGRVSPMPAPPVELCESPLGVASRPLTPASPIPGFPALRSLPYPIQGTDPVAVPPASPFLNATSRALDRDPDRFQLQEADFSPRTRPFLGLPADQRSHRSSSPDSDSGETSGEAAHNETAGTEFQIRNESDSEGDPDEEPLAIGASVVLPPASTATGAIEVDASFPRTFLTPEDGPYVVQVELPRDYIDAGVEVHTRVRVNNVSQVTVSACGPTKNGIFTVGRDAWQIEREEERYHRWRNTQRMNDFVRWHLNAAVAYSLAIPITQAPDPAYTRVINDMSAVLVDVLFAGYAFYAIVRGRQPGLYRGTWADHRDRVGDDPRVFYQVFQRRRAARKWYRAHKKFRINLDEVPLCADPDGL